MELLHPLYNAFETSGKKSTKAIDDGGTVSDLVLAQMVGEALALMRDTTKNRIFSNRVVMILAISHYARLFSFNFAITS
ncbi:hypothetical protein XA68_14459 [Ophiocordyceps unilateralis]|uniref:Uncharacterized protein n=1 Tax=Ophiocordyceps unilateralis TaxID=268505 RepID=A0A2A9P8N5_OPHUN|nr:hypothetical protein XA68_14459 [Ophiocordyceps unilateralis]